MNNTAIYYSFIDLFIDSLVDSYTRFILVVSEDLFFCGLFPSYFKTRNCDGSSVDVRCQGPVSC